MKNNVLVFSFPLSTFSVPLEKKNLCLPLSHVDILLFSSRNCHFHHPHYIYSSLEGAHSP